MTLSYNDVGREVQLADLFVDVNVDKKNTITFDLPKLERDLNGVNSVKLTVNTNDYGSLQVSNLKFSKTQLNPSDGNVMDFLTNWKAITDMTKEWPVGLVINKNDNETVKIDAKSIYFKGNIVQFITLKKLICLNYRNPIKFWS